MRALIVFKRGNQPISKMFHPSAIETLIHVKQSPACSSSFGRGKIDQNN